MTAVFKYWKGCHKEEGVNFFCVAPVGKTRINGLKEIIKEIIPRKQVEGKLQKERPDSTAVR